MRFGVEVSSIWRALCVLPDFWLPLLFVYCFFASIGCVSFGFAELAIEILLVGSTFLGCVAFLIASVASFYASALCALVPFPKSTVGIDHHGSCVGGSSSLVRLSHVPESLSSEFVGFNLTKPLGEFRICAHF